MRPPIPDLQVWLTITKKNESANEASRTIVLDEPATGDVLAFLEANATKLS